MFASVPQIARLAHTSRQAIEKALKGIVEGRTATWHGHALEVRTVHGRGGRSGLQYEVRVSSLPQHLQERLKASETSDEARSKLRLGDAAQRERNWKADVIRFALASPKGSRERAAEIEKLHGTQRLGWNGNRITLNRTTLRSWIQAYESGEGVFALARNVRADKGRRRTFISLAWDNTVPFDAEDKETIRTDLKIYVRSLVKSGSQLKQTRILAADKLKEMCAARGFRLNDPSQEAVIFAIPAKFVNDENHYKAVYRHKKDRKASEDNRPRVRRTAANLEPMEVVIMDVHHLNVLVRRDDGTSSTPKAIAFMDAATKRVFCEIIQFDSRGGVRNSDIITAFANMCQRPAWGVPKHLYVDNGSEYNFVDTLEDALKLGMTITGFDGQDERNRIIRSIPYNAAAKPIEGFFRQLNQQYIRHLPGWIDDDRMNPKRSELGKLPEPYKDGFDALCADISGLLTAYENMPQKGDLKGKSPAMALREHLRNGWAETVMAPEGLLSIFTEPATRVVRQHGIEVKGRTWTCDGMDAYFRRTVVAHVPKYHGFEGIRITGEDGTELGIAIAAEAYEIHDQRGAKESARRRSTWNKGLNKLDKSVPYIDVGKELIDFGAKQPPVIPNEPIGTISVARPQSPRLAILPVPAADATREQEEAEEQRITADAQAELVNALKRMAS